MIDQTATYDQPAVYLPRLIDWAQCGAIANEDAARVQRRQASPRDAQIYEALAAEYRRIAKRAEQRLTSLTAAAEPTSTDAPPNSLPALVDWLRGKLGSHFPGLAAEGWQTAAYQLWVWKPQP